MKKSLFLGMAALAVAASSCSSDEVLDQAQGNAMGFDVFVNKSTKATSADDATLANLSEISVYGHTMKDDKSSLIFENQSVTKNNGTWTYSPLRWWIVGNAYDFSAFAPVNPAEDEPYWKFTPDTNPSAETDGCGVLTWNNQQAAANKDLIYAYYAIKSATNTQPAVPFTFNHLLSRVKFTFENGFESSGIKMKIANLRITNMGTSAQIDLAQGLAAAQWSSIVTTYDRQFNFGGTTPVGTSAEFDNTASVSSNHYYDIPQADKNFAISFDVLLSSSSNGVETTYSHTTTLTLTTEIGKSYNLTCKLDQNNIAEDVLKPIQFNVVEVESWEAEGWEDNDLNLNVHP